MPSRFEMKLSRFEKKITYEFKDKKLLEQSLTHSSFAYESQSEEKKDNEVLEFLGDSVLGFVVADYLCTSFPELTEGELSKLKASVSSTTALCLFAREIRLPQTVLLGKGEEKSGGRKKKTILAGAMEALIAAIYLDGGMDAAARFILRFLETFFKKIEADKFLVNNYKSALQEYFQKERNGAAPVYKTLSTKGPDHQKRFVVEVKAEERTLAKARGSSIKDAEQKAAQRAMKNILGKKIKILTSETFLLKKGK
ncbi:MAG: ribonuclease III [Acidobacteria bacterium]|nr:ribonuclease III [Acidobacteriota bacterium]